MLINPLFGLRVYRILSKFVKRDYNYVCDFNVYETKVYFVYKFFKLLICDPRCHHKLPLECLSKPKTSNLDHQIS